MEVREQTMFISQVHTSTMCASRTMFQARLRAALHAGPSGGPQDHIFTCMQTYMQTDNH